jgi:pimeloyl-ACP methyl ester carboxylesterase
MREHSFVVGSSEDPVPGVAWLPARRPTRPRCPIVVFGHGLSHDKRSPLHAGLARRLAAEEGILSLALDAPAHGDRPGARALDASQQWLAYRESWTRAEGRDMAAAIRAAIAQVCAEHGVVPGPLGYWGLSLGTQYGLAFLADNPQVSVAVLGLFGSGPRVDRYAGAVRCPVFFLRQLGDAMHAADATRALYQRFPHPGCRLVSNPGAHEAVPREASEAALAFLLEHLA